MPPKRKGPVFKPPRPVNDATQSANSTSAPKRATGAAAARPAGVTKKAAPAPARRSNIDAILLSDSDEEGGQEDDAQSNPDRDELMMDDVQMDHVPALAQPQLEPIPQRLLGRLLQEGFEDENTKIHRGAMELTSKYMDIFVREALMRAVQERRDANKRNGGGSITDGFLNVEDLERLGPQLVLDF